MVLLWGERNACGGTVSLQHHQLWKIQQPVQLRWATARALSVKRKKKENSVKVALGLEFTVTSSCWLTLRYNTTHTIEWLECLGFILGIILSHMCICTELVVVYLWHHVYMIYKSCAFLLQACRRSCTRYRKRSGEALAGFVLDLTSATTSKSCFIPNAHHLKNSGQFNCSGQSRGSWTTIANSCGSSR